MAESSLRAYGRMLQRFGRDLFVDPAVALQHWKGLSSYCRNALQWSRLNGDPRFRIALDQLHYATYDKYSPGGTATGQYFFQDLWAAQRLHELSVREHVDVGSRVDGFVAHVLTFARVIYVDIRPLNGAAEGLEFRQGSLLDLPFASDSVASLSCLHVLEHAGLGRYGDSVDPEAYRLSARELQRILKPGGYLLIGVPIGRERLCFDAHRVFSPKSIMTLFSNLELREFSLIPDRGDRVSRFESFDRVVESQYACGLFMFQKPSPATASA